MLDLNQTKHRLMKQRTKWIATGLAAANALIIVSSAQAQGVTGTPYLSNVDPSTLNTPPSALYANWATAGATFSSHPTGLEVNSTPSYGSLYYVIPGPEVQTLNPAVTTAQLTFTINGDPAPYIWVGTPFTLSDNFGSVGYGGYSGSGNPGNPSNVQWNGNVVTWTVPLAAGQLAAIQAGTDAIYSFNLQFDPAVLAAGSYDVTFNSLVLTVPEPSSVAMLALGAGGWLIARRRGRAS